MVHHSSKGMVHRIADDAELRDMKANPPSLSVYSRAILKHSTFEADSRLSLIRRTVVVIFSVVIHCVSMMSYSGHSLEPKISITYVVNCSQTKLAIILVPC